MDSNAQRGEEVSRWQLVKFGLRHPLKAVGVLIAAGLGMWLAEEAEWGMKWMAWEIQVMSGRSAQSHQIAEGIDV